MARESGGYIVEYVLCACVFLIVIMARYFGARRFPNQKTRLFSIILWVVLADLVFDVVSSVIIDNVFLVPVAVTYVVNTIFYALQTLLPLFMTIYALTMAKHLDRAFMVRLLPLMAPGLMQIAALLLDFITHDFFYVDPVEGYVHAELFILCYVTCLFYMAATAAIAIRYRARLKREEFRNLCAFLLIVLCAMAIQFVYPRLLLTGLAMAIAVTMMYFTLQNPDSMLDHMTGAFNYDAMLTFLRDRASERSRIRLVAVKVRNIHHINELVGVENGSLLLRELGEFLMGSVSDAWVFRMRGACFVTMTRSPGNYRELCELVDERVRRPWVVGGTEILLAATVCRIDGAELLSETLTPEETVNYLETIFIQNERSGDQIRSVTVGAELLDGIQRRKLVEAALREALRDGEGFELYYQPIWSVKSGGFCSAEALLRFNHPEMGFIPPDEFVPIAESCGLVTAMDELVVRKACAFLRDSGDVLRSRLRVLEINLSALEFMHRRLPEMLNGIVTEYGVEPGRLCFEITETAATESFELLRDCMTELCERGFRFALDDFGTGYANISQVIQLPFSMVKLDRTLLYGPRIVPEDMARMFARMERRTVLEGVETREQSAFAARIGIDYIQGYYYSRPLPERDFLDFLQISQPKAN